MLPLAADPRWLGPSPALVARLFGKRYGFRPLSGVT